MTTQSPIHVANLFPEICRRLIALLRKLSPDEWHLPTVSSRRNVKDIASHLLDGSLRRLSMQRDGYFPADGSSQPHSNESLLDFLTRLNSEWETGTRRLSPRVLIDMLERADQELAELFESLDPHGPAIFPVAWAGEQQSENWMDIARDYAEKWHHSEQIFEATGRPSTIRDPGLFHPCLEIFLRALPFTYRGVRAAAGKCVQVTITGPAGGVWNLESDGTAWHLVARLTHKPHSSVTINEDVAWKLFTKRRHPDLIRRQFPDIKLTGDHELGSHVLEMVSVMA